MTTHDSELEAARMEIKAQSAALARATAEVERLNAALRDARTRPFRLARRLIVHNILKALAGFSPPIPKRMAERFGRSAAKRDPARIDSMVERNATAYPAIRAAWARNRSRDAAIYTAMANDLAKDGPLISVIVPVYNPDPALMNEMIASVQAQTYPNWELCLADDASTDPGVRKALEQATAQDKRIRVTFRETNGHISAASNSAMELAQGSYFALVDHDDLLDPDALLVVADLIRQHPDARVIYSDEDKISEDGTYYDPHFKPDWNRELLYGHNYISHLGVYEAGLMREIGGFRTGFEGAQDYDLLLRCVERIEDSQIHHIPKVLYSWRATAGSAAMSGKAKPYAQEAGRRALEEHLERRLGRKVPVLPGPVPYSQVAQWPVLTDPLVSIIIPTRDHLPVLRVAVESILTKTLYPHYEIIIIDNGSTETETLDWLQETTAQHPQVRVLRDDGPFNYSALNNRGVAASKGSMIALVNNDIEVISPDWLTEMVALAEQPDVGCVGAKLYYPNDTIQHAGVVIGIGGVAGHGHQFFARSNRGYMSRLAFRQDYTAVTAACLVIKKETFEKVGGLNDVDLTVAFNDVDLCLKVNEAGYRNIWTPHAELYHHESLSRGHDRTGEKHLRFLEEVSYMQQRWKTDTFKDPAYNPNLTRWDADFTLAPVDETPPSS